MNHLRSAPQKAHLSMWAWTLIVGVSFPVVSALSDDLPLFQLNSLRLLIALLALLPFIPRKNKSSPSSRALLLYTVLGGCLAGFFAAMFWAAPRISPVTMSSLYVSVPLLSYFLNTLQHRSSLSKGLLPILLTGAAGALLLARTGTTEQHVYPEFKAGAGVFLLGCIAAAAYPVLSKWGISKHWLPANAATRTAWSLFAGVLICVLAGLLLESPSGLIQITRADLFVLSYLGIFSTAMTFWLSQYATTYLQPSEVQAYSYLLPLVSICVLLMKGTTSFQLLWIPGAILVLTCIGLILKRSPGIRNGTELKIVDAQAVQKPAHYVSTTSTNFIKKFTHHYF